MQKLKSDLKSRAYAFSLTIIEFVNILPNKRSAWIISDQVLRSGTSIGANITEARGSGSRLEFKRYYEIALKSANETRYWLELLKDLFIASKEKVDSIINELEEITKILASSIITLKKKS